MPGKNNSFPSSEFALLGFLVPGPCHGYELHKIIAEVSGIGMVWGVKMSNLYAQLEKLEQKGWITGALQPGESKPARKVFSLTDTGRETLDKWLFQIVKHPRDLRQEFLVRVYFLTQYRPEQLEAITQNQLEECQRWFENTSSKEFSKTDEGSFEQIVFQFRRSQIQSMLDWLNWILIQIPNIISQRGKQ